MDLFSKGQFDGVVGSLRIMPNLKINTERKIILLGHMFLYPPKFCPDPTRKDNIVYLRG